MAIVEQNEGFITSYLCQFVYNVNGVLSAIELLKCCMFILKR
jgi:hypothetical protein